MLSYDETNTVYGWFRCSCRRTVRKQLRYVFNGYAGKQKGDRTTTCGGPAHEDKRVAADPTYRTAHGRLDRAFGLAKTHACTVCGATGKAQWSYLWSSSEPRLQQAGKDKGRTFSLDGDDYSPMCKEPCHGNWDRANRKLLEGLPKASVSLVHIALSEVGYLDGLRVKEGVE